MPKGRHRKQQLTQLPAGVQAVTGKQRTASKNQIYKRPLPIHVDQEDSKRSSHIATYTFPAWADYLLTLFGYPSSKSMQKQREIDTVQGRWDPLSKSVYLDVTVPSSSQSTSDEGKMEEQSAAMRFIWESGFFGKGTLSRSEPTWHKRQVNTIRVQRARERGGKVFTPEELTALRRKERKAAKIERARLAVKAGQQLPDGIVALGGELTAEEELAIERAAERELNEEEKDESAYGQHIPGLIYLKPAEKEEVVEQGVVSTIEVDEEEYIDIADMERLQLSNFETFFLAGMLGVLEVLDGDDNVLSLEHLYSMLMATSLPHAVLKSSPFTTPNHHQLDSSSIRTKWSRPDNPFLLHYIVYHHYRSLGWVVKDGIKFCCNFLLYKKGPAFSHAEFAVIVVPIYEDPDDEASSPFGKHPNGNERNWVWFSSVNRVNTQVLKTVILCHIIIPSMASLEYNLLDTPASMVQALKDGKLYNIREYSIRRFTPQRMRA